MNPSKTPSVRFRGYEDEWEVRKLTDVTYSYSGLTYSPTDVQDKGTFVLRSSNVKNDQLIDADNVYVNPDIVNSNNVKVGDVIVVVRNGSRSLIGKHAIVTKEMPHTVIGAFMSAFRGENGDYINALLSTNNFQKEVHKSLGATINQITGKDFSMMNFLTPKLEEQNKIGSFFKQLDNTIALHQRKLDLLNEQKKGFLQKMFPKNGEKIPEIRFAGFNDDWEERKLSDIANKAVDNRGKTPTISEDGNHPLLEVASLGNGAPDYSKVTKYLSDETFMAELRAYIREGDILFSTVGSIGLVSLMDTNENAAIAQNIVAFRANEKYDSKFLYAMLSTKDNQHKAQRIVMGAVQPSIKVSQLVDVDYCVTENMEEQRKLGEYFLNLDNLITLHQRELF